MELLHDLNSLTLGTEVPLAALSKRTQAKGALNAEVERAENGRRPWGAIITLIV
eukprot:COSAG01_NODE_14144_length_1491_cov_1.509339_2_plen_54_part_00